MPTSSRLKSLRFDDDANETYSVVPQKKQKAAHYTPGILPVPEAPYQTPVVRSCPSFGVPQYSSQSGSLYYTPPQRIPVFMTSHIPALPTHAPARFVVPQAPYPPRVPPTPGIRTVELPDVDEEPQLCFDGESSQAPHPSADMAALRLDLGSGSALDSLDMKTSMKPATTPPCLTIILTSTHFPWRITVRAIEGSVTVGDVVEAIYTAFRKLVTEEEVKALRQLGSCQMYLGVRRMDLLDGRTVFAGIDGVDERGAWIVLLRRNKSSTKIMN